MIKKTPKKEVYIPKAVKALKKERRKIREGRTFFSEIKPLEAKLEATIGFWESYLKQEFSLEMIPKIFRYLLNNPSKRAITFTNGSTFIYASSSKENKTVTLEKGRRGKPISQEEAKEKRMIWVSATHTLLVDKKRHFLKRLMQRNFDLTLIVPFYEEAIGKMPKDTVIISDHTTKLIGYKRNGLSLVLSTGMTIGEIDWDEYVDKKF